MTPQQEVGSTPAGMEPDLSWFDIAVDGRGNVVVTGFSSGWANPDFSIETHWEDNFAIDAPTHLAPGFYRWSGFKVGFWDEDDAINLTGGEFTKYVLSAQVQS